MIQSHTLLELGTTQPSGTRHKGPLNRLDHLFQQFEECLGEEGEHVVMLFGVVDEALQQGGRG